MTIREFLKKPTTELLVAKILSSPMQEGNAESIWNSMLQILRLSIKGSPDDHYRILNLLKEYRVTLLTVSL